MKKFEGNQSGDKPLKADIVLYQQPLKAVQSVTFIIY